VEIQIVTEEMQILSLLYRFDSIFVHLREKVPDYNAFAKKLAKNALVYHVQKNKETCGLAVMYANDTKELTAFITLFGVLPKWQGKHLGRELMDVCSKEAIVNGMKRIRLEVDLDNHNAIAFYTRNGFIPQEVCSGSSIYMERSLV